MTHDIYVHNVKHVLGMAKESQVKDGKNWYLEARTAAAKISMESGVSIIKVCGVIAALSPRNKWNRNLLDAYNLCMNSPDAKFATFRSNVDKARRILHVDNYDRIVDILGGQKVTAFFENIFNPDSKKVTVDVHMQMVALGKYLPENERPALTKKIYKEIEKAIQQVALDNGLLPYQAQAIAWVTWKEVNK